MSEDNGLPINHVSKGKIDIKPYNGWDNFATWRVAHDILNHHQWDDSEEITIDYLKELVDNAVFDNTGVPTTSLLASYAKITLNRVDWAELADVYSQERKHNTN